MSTNIYNATTDKLKDIGSGGGGDPEALEAIENTIAPSSTKEEEGAITATKPHSEGDYFNLGGVLVKVLDDISVGDTLEEGVNIESTNIGAELERIDSGLAGKASVSDVNGVQAALTVTDPDEGSGVITFGVDANGNYGYKKVGADSVTPFKSGQELQFLLQSIEKTWSLTDTQSGTRYFVNFGAPLDLKFDTDIVVSKGNYIMVFINGTYVVDSTIIKFYYSDGYDVAIFKGSLDVPIGSYLIYVLEVENPKTYTQIGITNNNGSTKLFSASNTKLDISTMIL